MANYYSVSLRELDGEEIWQEAPIWDEKEARSVALKSSKEHLGKLVSVEINRKRIAGYYQGKELKPKKY